MLNSPTDIAIIAAIALLVFGPKKIPELGRAIGQAIGNFKHGLEDAESKDKEKDKPADSPNPESTSPPESNPTQ